jgi:hypothetical protein
VFHINNLRRGKHGECYPAPSYLEAAEDGATICRTLAQKGNLRHNQSLAREVFEGRFKSGISQWVLPETERVRTTVWLSAKISFQVGMARRAEVSGASGGNTTVWIPHLSSGSRQEVPFK